MYYLNMFLSLSFQIHICTGNHNYHSCFHTLRTLGRNAFLPRIHQYLRQKNITYAAEIDSIILHSLGKEPNVVQTREGGGNPAHDRDRYEGLPLHTKQNTFTEVLSFSQFFKTCIRRAPEK